MVAAGCWLHAKLYSHWSGAWEHTVTAPSFTLLVSHDMFSLLRACPAVISDWVFLPNFLGPIRSTNSVSNVQTPFHVVQFLASLCLHPLAFQKLPQSAATHMRSLYWLILNLEVSRALEFLRRYLHQITGQACGWLGHLCMCLIIDAFCHLLEKEKLSFPEQCRFT